MIARVASLASRAGRIQRYLSGYVGVRGDDVILSSFPRSGNTWIRFILCNIISLSEWEGRTVDFPLLNRTMPALGASNLLTPWPHPTIARVVKTHRPYSPLLARARSIGIVRDPRDVMVSYYHFAHDRKRNFAGTFDEFLEDPRIGLEAWFRHYASWRDRWTVTLRYEDLRAETQRELRRVIELVAPNVPDDLLTEAIRRSSIGHTRAAESSDVPTEGDAVFARSGAAGQWTAYFSEDALARYARLAESFGVDLYP